MTEENTTEETTLSLFEQAIQAPALIGGGSAIEGMEETDVEDIKIPRIKLLQGSSDEIKNPDEYPDLKVGMIINSLTHTEADSQKLGDKKVYPFIPVKMFKSWMKFNAYNASDEGYDSNYEPGAVIFKTYDKADPVTRTEDAWKYKQINFLGYQPSNPMQPVFVSFSSMSRPCGEEMINIVQLAARPLFHHLFLLGSKTEVKNGNTFCVYTAKSEGKPSDELCLIGRKMFTEFNPLLQDMKNKKVELHSEDTTEPEFEE